VCCQSVIDDVELQDIQSAAETVREYLAAGQYREALFSYLRTLGLVDTYSNGIELYNFLEFNVQYVSSDKRTLLTNGAYFAVK